MRRRKLSERIDLDAAAFERNAQAFERVLAAVVQIEKRLDEYEQLVEENKAFIRDVTRRNEKAVEGLIRRDEGFDAEPRLGMGAASTSLRELLEETRAQSQAIFILIDRMPPP